MSREEFMQKVRDKIDSLTSEFFTVQFIKRTTGELRKMRCRKGVKKYLKGGPPAYDFKEKNLIPVFDLDKEEYRSIPLENVVELHANGEILKI
jgi:hypothetical protein